MEKKKSNKIDLHISCMECLYRIDDLTEYINSINERIADVSSIEDRFHREAYLRALEDMLNSNLIKIDCERRKYDAFAEQINTSIIKKIINKITNYTY